MTGAFHQLCAEVDRAAHTAVSLEPCHPHYQKVLEYILAHPEERDEIATALSRVVGREHQPGGTRGRIHLVQFLMESLQWPEIKAAAEERYDNGGHALYGREIQDLLKVYDVV